MNKTIGAWCVILLFVIGATNSPVGGSKTLATATSKSEPPACDIHIFHFSVTFLPDNKLVLVNGDESKVVLYDLAIGTTLRTFVSSAPEPRFDGLAHSRDGQYLAVITFYGVIDVFDVRSGARLHTFSHAPTGPLTFATVFVDFSPDSKAVIGADNDGVYFWDIGTGKLTHIFPIRGALEGWVRISPIGKHLIAEVGDESGSVQLIVWDIRTMTVIHEFKDVLRALYTANGKYLVTYGVDGLQVHDASNFRLIRTVYDEEDQYINLSPDGKYVVGWKVYGIIRIWEIETGKLVNTFGSESEPLEGGWFLLDSEHILTAEPYYPGSSKGPNIFQHRNVVTGKVIRRIAIEDREFFRYAFSPDGNYVVTEDFEGVVQV
jgi:WD40 repeat protein